MPTESPVAKDSPLWRAWQAYKETPEYANTLHWAVQPEHAEGSLWAAFSVGFLGSSGAGTPHDTPDAQVVGMAHCDECGFNNHWLDKAPSLCRSCCAPLVGSQPAPRETPDADDLLAFLDDTFSGGNEIRFCATSEPVDERSRTEERGGATVVWVDEPLPVNEFGDTERRHECLSDALRAWYKRDARTVESQPAPSETPDDTARLDWLESTLEVNGDEDCDGTDTTLWRDPEVPEGAHPSYAISGYWAGNQRGNSLREAIDAGMRADVVRSHLPTSETTDG